MRVWQQWWRIHSRGLGFLAMALALSWAGVTSADRFPPDPVEALRQTLKAPVRNPAARAEALERDTQNLRTLGDLRRALLLQEWRDEIAGELDEAILKVDQASRNQVLKRFEEEVKKVLAQGTPTGQLAIAQMLGDQVLGEASQTAGKAARIRTAIGISFGPAMAELTKTGDPRVRIAAARALGRMNPKLEVAVPALRELLASPEPAERMAAVEGLLNLVMSAQTVSRSREEIIGSGQSVAEVAAQALRDPNPLVRRLGAETLYQSAAALAKQVMEPRQRDEVGDVEEYRKDINTSRAELLPLIRALQDQIPALARALSDADPQVRLFASQALEELGNARLRFYRLLESLPPSSSGRGPDQPADTVTPVAAETPEDPLLQALRKTLPELRRALADPDVNVQLATLDVLETLGADARPAAPELIQTLSHPNRFVRWAAARTLGKTGPVAVATAVPQLSRMLFDKDLDLDLAAAKALERFGPAAKGAVPDLIRSLGASDAEMRLAAIRALEGIGTDAQPAIPALTAALADPDLRVRRTAAEVLGRFGPLAAEAEPGLRRTLNDPIPEVRQAAGDALLSILRH